MMSLARAGVTFEVFRAFPLGLIALAGEFTEALFVLADRATAFFVDFRLAGGEDIGGFGNNLNWRGDDIGGQPGDAAACHQGHQAQGERSRHVTLRFALYFE
jgi:hypothetical protein